MAPSTALQPMPPVGPTGRSFAPIVTNDSWLRCGHTGTAIDLDDEVVTLAWEPADGAAPWPVDAAVEAAGLAFDANGCLYHGDPARGQIQRVPWQPAARQEAPVDLLAPAPELPADGFHPVAPEVGITVRAIALAVDADEHLFVLDGLTRQIFVMDLADGHVLRSIELRHAAVDLAPWGRVVVAATNDRDEPLVRVDALGLPRPVPLPAAAAGLIASLPPAARPDRVAVGPRGELWILMRDASSAWAVPIDDRRRAQPIEVAGATDIELDGRSKLVVAGPPATTGDPRPDLRRFVLTTAADTEDAPLAARGYDGRGIVRTPDGRIGYWNGAAFRIALTAARRFASSGHVDCFRLDSGAYQQQWGRVFVEACVPAGARIRVGFVTSDDEPDWLEPEGPSIPAGAPALLVDGEAGSTDLPPPNEPPLVGVGLEPTGARPWMLHRREIGTELPWHRPAPGDRFEVYEAPVQAPPGRYLWLRLMLDGTTKVTPQVRAVRAEFPGHDLLRRLPRAYGRDPVAASFLRRYLALADGVLSEMELRSAQRDFLLDPFGAPPEVLPWLASLIGLTLDGRWPEPARRQLLAEAVCLFRRRGTISGLRRMLEIYLGTEVVIIEAFRLRGAGGARTGAADDERGVAPQGSANAIVGYGFRVGGEVGEATASPLSGSVADAFETRAHRFSVIVPRDLDEEQLETVRDLLDLHRPAHTIVDVCPAGRGMRVGIGLHVALSTVVGPSSGFPRAVVGETRVGTNAVIGRPRAGVRAGGSRLGENTVVDP
jgi:phage tail-like protein